MHRENEDFRDEQEDGRGGPGCGPGRAERGQGDHLDETAREWQEAFFQALHEVRVEALKSKIKSAWGKNIDGTAKEVLAAMFAEWKEFQKEQEAKKTDEKKPDARQGLKDILKKGMKKGPQ